MRTKHRKSTRRSRCAGWIRRKLPSRAFRRRVWRAYRRAPRHVQGFSLLATLLLLWFAANGVYQVIRKPSELFFPVSGTLNKSPPQTWAEYAKQKEKYSTANISAELLAALAQIEGSGNPIIRTYWRWSWNLSAFDVYRPASSSVGMYQITNGTFAEARRYCIRNHEVIEDGPWNDWRSCWFNSLYLRVLPSHAVELTAAYLDRAVATTLTRHHVNAASAERRHELAAVIHLCGAGAGDAYVRRGLRLIDGQKCGDHDARDYVSRVRAAERVFAGLRAAR